MLNCISLPRLRHAASVGVEKTKLPHWFQKLVSALCSLGLLGIDQRKNCDLKDMLIKNWEFW